MSYSTETLIHFHCNSCHYWWTIANAPLNRAYYCPWCGKFQPPGPQKTTIITTSSSSGTTSDDQEARP